MYIKLLLAMKIIVAKHAGFCSGVKRAIDIAEKVAKDNNEKIYVYGQLVHNERVIEELEKKGMVFVDNIEKIPDNSIVVLRAHGEPGTTYESLNKKGIKKETTLNDATCPLVTSVHNAAIKLKNNGYEVILFGKKNHPEAIGTSYHIRGKNTFVAESADDATYVMDYIKENNFGKVAIISQTTMSVADYTKFIENINKLSKDKFYDMPLNINDMSKKFVFINTICDPTKQRQFDSEKMAKEADVILVIGGKNSSNSKELAAKCMEFCKDTYFIQSASQIEKGWFKNKKFAGVTAGASTPDVVINEVIEKIKNY